jgi:hypothetical protein
MLILAAASVWGFTSPHYEAAFLSASADPSSMGTTVSPISVTMQCVISLTIQYIFIFTGLGIVRSVLDFRGVAHSSSAVCKALKHGSETMFYAPMVCLMMLGLRMRVLQLTKGTGNPPEWVQLCMHSVTYAILVNTLLVMLIPVFVGTTVEVTDSGELDTAAGNPFESKVLAIVFTVVRYLVVLGLYVGFGGIIVGVFTFEPPKGVWDGPVTPVSPAVKCTVILSSGFFFVYLCQAISRSYTQFTGSSGLSHFESVMAKAADTFALAPMLCAIFLAARMRALQMDPISGNPQPWAQNCFFACTYGVITMTVLAVLVPLLLNGKVKPGGTEGEVAFELPENGVMSKVLTVCRFLAMFSIYAGFTAVVCSVFTMEHPEGDHLTPPLSATMQCVLNLSFQYFLIYFLLWVFTTVEDFFPSFNLSAIKDAIESAKSTVQFAPMLAVLFIGTRMRALQLSDNEGAPQKWVQSGMFLATWSLMIQFTMCLLLPLFTGTKYTPDSLDGSTRAENPVANIYGAYVVTFLRYFALLALMGGVATVITGMFLMTPETANGGGSVPVLDMVPEPVGVNDMPGAKPGMEGVGGTVGAGANGVAGASEAVTG